jgi:hypothetical protein
MRNQNSWTTTNQKTHQKVSQLPHVRFAVDETLYCFWDLDVHARNLEFIEKIDPKYFEHVANLHRDFLATDEKQYAAAALRIAYSHGLETLMAFLCALVQAPDCVIGWFLKYQNRELYNLVRKINDGAIIYSKLKKHRVTWEVISELVFLNFKTGDEAKDERIQSNFARLWQHFAYDFLDEKSNDEYNSIKHGMRARMGGFYLAMGLEEVPGIPAPLERMETMANSEFGSSFFVAERLHDNRNFLVHHQSLNWHPENLDDALHLISASIHNAVACLRVLHGVPLKTVPFCWFETDETYDLPWSRSSSVTSFAMNSQVTETAITPLSKEDILAVYIKRKNDEID